MDSVSLAQTYDELTKYYDESRNRSDSKIQTKDMTGELYDDEQKKTYDLYKETRGLDATAQCWHVYQIQEEKSFKKLHKSSIKEILKYQNKGGKVNKKLVNNELDSLWASVSGKINSPPVKEQRNQETWGVSGIRHLPAQEGDKCKCYICGLPIIKNSGTSAEKAPDGGQCEHIIPVATLSTIVPIPKNEYIKLVAGMVLNDPHIKDEEKLTHFKQIIITRTLLLVLLFDWAHPFCNIFKSDYPFFNINYNPSGGYKISVNEKTLYYILCGIFKVESDAKTLRWKFQEKTGIEKYTEIKRVEEVNKRFDAVKTHLTGILNIINDDIKPEELNGCQYYSLQLLQNIVYKKCQIFSWKKNQKDNRKFLRYIFGKGLYKRKLVLSVKKIIGTLPKGGSSKVRLSEEVEVISIDDIISFKGLFDRELPNLFESDKSDESDEINKHINRIMGKMIDEHEFYDLLEFYLDYLYDEDTVNILLEDNKILKDGNSKKMGDFLEKEEGRYLRSSNNNFIYDRTIIDGIVNGDINVKDIENEIHKLTNIKELKEGIPKIKDKKVSTLFQKQIEKISNVGVPIIDSETKRLLDKKDINGAIQSHLTSRNIYKVDNLKSLNKKADKQLTREQRSSIPEHSNRKSGLLEKLNVKLQTIKEVNGGDMDIIKLLDTMIDTPLTGGAAAPDSSQYMEGIDSSKLNSVTLLYEIQNYNKTYIKEDLDEKNKNTYINWASINDPLMKNYINAFGIIEQTELPDVSESLKSSINRIIPQGHIEEVTSKALETFTSEGIKISSEKAVSGTTLPKSIMLATATVMGLVLTATSLYMSQYAGKNIKMKGKNK